MREHFTHLLESGFLREGERFGSLDDSKGFLSADELVQHRYGEITVTEAAGVLGISRQAVHKALERGALQARVIRTLRLVSAASVAAYRDARK